MPPSSDVGAVELAVRLSDAATVGQVSFQISGNGIAPIVGGIALGSAAATASAFVGGIAAASSYHIDMTASSTDGQTSCAGNGTFDVRAGENSSVNVLLQCRAFSITGGVTVGGTFNNCPRLTSVAASRVSAPVGGTIDVRAAASDQDPGDVLTFKWTTTSGSFDRPQAPEATFRCTVPGAPVLTATVSDGQCNDVVAVAVSCVAAACGNGFIDPGEQCDPPVPGMCDGTCHRISVCGNGITESGEQCDPPNGTTCDSSCRTISGASPDAGTAPDVVEASSPLDGGTGAATDAAGTASSG